VVILNKDYAEVVKARESCESSHKKIINTVKQFVFWETSEDYEPTPGDDNKTNEEKDKTARRKNLIKSWDVFRQVKSDTKDTLQ
jgi:hypothetical protein